MTSPWLFGGLAYHFFIIRLSWKCCCPRCPLIIKSSKWEKDISNLGNFFDQRKAGRANHQKKCLERVSAIFSFKNGEIKVLVVESPQIKNCIFGWWSQSEVNPQESLWHHLECKSCLPNKVIGIFREVAPCSWFCRFQQVLSLVDQKNLGFDLPKKCQATHVENHGENDVKNHGYYNKTIPINPMSFWAKTRSRPRKKLSMRQCDYQFNVCPNPLEAGCFFPKTHQIHPNSERQMSNE